MGKDYKEYIIKRVDEILTLTFNKLVVRASEYLNIIFSSSSRNICLQGFHYMLKTLAIGPERRNGERTIKIRVAYAIKYGNKSIEVNCNIQIILIGEVGFNV